MTTDPHRAPDVPLAEVAAEDPAESVQHEAEATEGLDAVGAGDPGLDNDEPPADPAITSVTGMGPVSAGDDLTI
jgi:hypothetical protein